MTTRCKSSRHLLFLSLALAGGMLARCHASVFAADKAAINGALKRATTYLQQHFDGGVRGQRTLSAYTLYKIDESSTKEEVTSAVDEVLTLFEEGKYKGTWHRCGPL